jgi:hypothetical protein
MYRSYKKLPACNQAKFKREISFQAPNSTGSRGISADMNGAKTSSTDFGMTWDYSTQELIRGSIS